jgi:hypothetical protein
VALEIQGEALVARPGDTVLLTMRAPMSMALHDRIRTELEERMPGVQVVVVDQVSATVLYRPAELATAPADHHAQ